MKTEWTSDIYEAGNDYDQTKIIGIEGGEDDLVEMTESEVAMLVNAVDNPSGKMPTTTHIVTARRISEIISGVWTKIKNALGKKVDKVAGKNSVPKISWNRRIVVRWYYYINRPMISVGFSNRQYLETV